MCGEYYPFTTTYIRIVYRFFGHKKKHFTRGSKTKHKLKSVCTFLSENENVILLVNFFITDAVLLNAESKVPPFYV